MVRTGGCRVGLSSRSGIKVAISPRLSRFPGLSLTPLRASVPESRLNSFIDELQRDYGVTVGRRVLDAAQKSQLKEHLAEIQRKKMAGALVSAGPDGVEEFAFGTGKVKPPTGGRRFSVPSIT